MLCSCFAHLHHHNMFAPKLSLCTMDATMDAMQMKRQRTRASIGISDLQYKAALHELWMQTPIMDIAKQLGPTLANTCRKVTPGQLMTIHPLFMPLIESGCATLVLQSTKIMTALNQLVVENPILVPNSCCGQGTEHIKVPIFLHDVKDHIMACASMMRALRNEGSQIDAMSTTLEA